MLTLKQWCDNVGVLPTHPTTETGAVSTCIYPSELTAEQQWDLYHLSDYAVSTVSGPVIWLVPRAKLDS